MVNCQFVFARWNQLHPMNWWTQPINTKHITYYMFHTSLCELHFILAIWRKNYIGAFVDKHQHRAPTKSLGHYYFNQIYLQTYLSWQAAERDFNLWGIFQQHTRYSADSSTISYLQHYRSPIISTNGATFLQLVY